jgi:hypothetical protein
MKRLSIAGLLLPWATPALLFLLIVGLAPAQAQSADSLGQVRKIYIDTSLERRDAAEISKHLGESLRRDHSIEIVTDPNGADAILKTNSEVWVKAYISVSPRSPGNKYPVYGGFLSAQLTGKGGDTLWSYLVTPSRYASSGVEHDLADQLARKLLSALHEAAPATSHPTKGTRILKVAGATFPAPLYQAWIESFREHHPDISDHLQRRRLRSWHSTTTRQGDHLRSLGRAAP